MVNDHKAVQRQTAQYDLFNRVHSIAGDEAFVRTVSEHYGGRFEVVANQRCGTWYCDPSSSSSTYAYFKSTDGHAGTWGFNMRRANLALADKIRLTGGIMLVDSTRRGKRMPDALSKTVPIWCTVINRAIAKRYSLEDFDIKLYLPPSIVSPSERDQIEERLSGWVDALESSSLPLPRLDRPLRPFWIHPSTRSLPTISPDAPFLPLICVSASKWVGSEDDVPSITKVENGRTVGFSYVQGAGDDDELWSRGLTASLFYQHKSAILQAEKDDLPDLVDDLVKVARQIKHTDLPSLDNLSISGISDAPIGVPNPSSRVSLRIGEPITETLAWSLTTSPTSPSSATHTIRVVLMDKHRESPFTYRYSPDTSVFACPSARVDPKAYRGALDDLVEYADDLMDEVEGLGLVLAMGTESDFEAAKRIAENAAQSRDDSGMSADQVPPLHPVRPTAERLIEYRKAIIPLALVLLLSIPDLSSESNSTATPDGEGEEASSGEIDKKVVGDLLNRIVALWPDGNPPRAALRKVNEYIFSANA